jgi:hypothetical protein
MWAPKLQRDGNRLQAYELMKEVRTGDRVFSYHEQQVRAVGTIRAAAVSRDKPGELKENWNREGWFVEVDYQLTETPFRPRDEWSTLQQLMPASYSPLDKNGNGAQKLYLSRISDELGRFLLAAISQGLTQTGKNDSPESNLPDLHGDDLSWWEEEQDVLENEALAATEKRQVVAARRGQGIFRTRVTAFEKHCRVTGVTDLRVLIASHIKPWSLSLSRERLDGNNGFMLAPHVDKLFDRGFITFNNSGELMTSPSLPDDVLDRWHIVPGQHVGGFTKLQAQYLEFHRDVVFEKLAR